MKSEKISDEVISLLFADKKALGVVLDGTVVFPTERVGHMCKCLDAGDELNSESVSVVVKLAHLFLGVASSHVSEIGLILSHEGVLAVEHRHGKTHQSALTEDALHCFHIESGVTLRNVEHRAVHIEVNRLDDLELLLAVTDMLNGKTESTEESATRVVNDSTFFAVEGNCQLVFLLVSYLKNVFAVVDGNVEHLGDDLNAVLKLGKVAQKSDLHLISPLCVENF